MKILFLTNIPSPYRLDFFNELGKYCDLTVTFEGKKATDRDDKWIGDRNESYNAIFLKGIRVKSDQFFCPGIINEIKKDFDQIIVSNYSSPTAIYAIKYLRLHHIKFWIEADGGIIPTKEKQIKYFLKKRLISSASFWLSSGNATSQYLMHYGAVNNRIYIYPFTSLRKKDILLKIPSVEEKEIIRKNLGMKASKIVLSVGQFISRKGFDILLQAWKLCVEDAELYIVGGEPSDEYIQLAKDLRLKNLHYVGFKSKQELAEYYKAADLFVLPTREDIWGLVINEAMANGLPIITTDRCIAGLELVKDGGNGYIVPVEDYKALAEKMVMILSNQSLQSEMQKNSLSYIKNYTIENMAIQHMKILEHSLN